MLYDLVAVVNWLPTVSHMYCSWSRYLEFSGLASLLWVSDNQPSYQGFSTSTWDQVTSQQCHVLVLNLIVCKITQTWLYLCFSYETWNLISLIYINIFSCDQAALWMVFSVRLSVCLSVCPSVRLSHLFDYVPIIVSSWNFQELSHWTRVRSMQKVKVRGQRSRSQRSRPKFSFPDCNSSLNSHMMMKWYI